MCRYTKGVIVNSISKNNNHITKVTWLRSRQCPNKVRNDITMNDKALLRELKIEQHEP
jgi:hypothetical protein